MTKLKRWLCPWIAALAIACVAAVGEVPHALAAPPSLEAFAGVVGGVLGGASVAPEVCDGAAFRPMEMTFYPAVFLHLKVPRGGISECGYEGGTSHVTEVAGPISASHSLGPAASQPYTGSAKAVASYRTLRAEARSEMSGDFDPLGSFPRGDASGAALFEDALTATSAALPAGSPGFVRYVFTIDGTLTSGNSTTGHVGGASVALHLEHVDTGQPAGAWAHPLPARIFAAEAIADYEPTILIRDGGHRTFVVSAGLVSGGGTFTSAFVWDGDTFDLPIHFGAPFWLKAGLVASTRFVGIADYAMTARLVELQFFDAAGNPVDDVSIVSASGTSYDACASPPCPRFGWVSSEWSECSALCGGGVQSRTVECRDEKGDLAPGACTDPQPPTTRLCNDGSCDSRWGDWSEWGPCSAWCGDGVTTRTRQCLRHDGTSAPESECVAAGPGTETKECALASCPSSGPFEWVTRVVSECSATCGGGTEVLDAACVDSTGQAVSDSSCTSPEPPLVQQCNTQPCPIFAWFNGPWSECSTLCGGGLQVRVVQCGDQSGQPAAESDCTNPMPPTTQFCNIHACPESTWVSGPWSECSATCGGGVRTRDVVCLDRDIRIAPETSCEGLPRPLTAQTCSTEPCATPTHSYAAHVQSPIHADHSSVFRANRGVVPGKFTLSDNGHPTCDLPPATIALTRTTGGTDAQVNEPDHTGPPDSGSNFRIDGCEYIYNLKTSALGVGSYWVGIIIDGQVVGSAIFSLK